MASVCSASARLPNDSLGHTYCRSRSRQSKLLCSPTLRSALTTPTCSTTASQVPSLVVVSPLQESDLQSNAQDDAHGGPHDEGTILVEQEADERMLLLLRERRTDEAWDLCDVAMSEARFPSSVCLSRLVAQLSHKGTASSLTRAQRLVIYLQRRKRFELLDSNSLSLLAMATSKHGITQYSASIIRMMLKHGLCPDVKAWSAVVNKLGKHREDVPLALAVFEEIREHIKREEHSGSGNSAEITKARPDTRAFNAVLNACATAGFADKAEKLFDQLEPFGLRPDVITFNILIKMYALIRNTDKLMTTLDKMNYTGVKPDQSTFNTLVAAYVGFNELERAVAITKALKEGKKDIRTILRGTMETNSKEPPVENGHHPATDEHPLEPLKLMAENLGKESMANLKPDTQTYSIIMKGYMQKGRSNDVRKILTAMQRQPSDECQPNEVTYTTVISTYVRLGMLDEARAILLEMAAHNVPANVVTYNVLLSGYCKEREMPKARLLMADMRNAGLKPDAVSHNTLIDGYINMEDSASAMAMFTQMRNAGIAPTRVTYTTLMKAFGLLCQPHVAAKVFHEMEQDSRMKVDVIAFNTLIESYSKAENVQGAKESLQKMRQYGLMPTVATYGSLIKLFAAAGKPSEALVLWNEIKERLEADEETTAPLMPDAGLLNGLVDICVKAAFFQKALEIIACMEKYQIPPDKIKYKRMLVEHHSKRYTSKHASQARRDRSAEHRQAFEAFKFWLGLPNEYYNSDWQG